MGLFQVSLYPAMTSMVHDTVLHFGRVYKVFGLFLHDSKPTDSSVGFDEFHLARVPACIGQPVFKM